MHILVTGGAGFIGSHFCKYLHKNINFESLTIVDKLTYAGIESNLNSFTNDTRIKLIKSDIRDTLMFEKEFCRSKYIFNFAAESHVDNSIESPQDFINTNIIGTFNLLELLRSKNPDARFIQISTDEVYGSLGFESSPSKEDSPLVPSSPYSASKASADLLVQSYFLTYGLNVLTTRSSNNYGPNQLPEKLIPKTISLAKEGQQIPVYGNGLNTRDWIYVDDNCEGVWMAAEKGRAGKVYHLGTGEEWSNIDLVKKLIKLIGRDDDLIAFVADRKGHDLRYSLSTEVTKKELKWLPKTTFDLGLSKTIDWYMNNSDWIEKAKINLKKRNSK